LSERKGGSIYRFERALPVGDGPGVGVALLSGITSDLGTNNLSFCLLANSFGYSAGCECGGDAGVPAVFLSMQFQRLHGSYGIFTFATSNYHKLLKFKFFDSILMLRFDHLLWRQDRSVKMGPFSVTAVHSMP
jgi:hypothetical protein